MVDNRYGTKILFILIDSIKSQTYLKFLQTECVWYIFLVVNISGALHIPRLPTRPVINTPVVSVVVHRDGEALPTPLQRPITLNFRLLETHERTKPVCVYWNHSIPWVLNELINEYNMLWKLCLCCHCRMLDNFVFVCACYLLGLLVEAPGLLKAVSWSSGTRLTSAASATTWPVLLSSWTSPNER